MSFVLGERECVDLRPKWTVRAGGDNGDDTENTLAVLPQPNPATREKWRAPGSCGKHLMLVGSTKCLSCLLVSRLISGVLVKNPQARSGRCGAASSTMHSYCSHEYTRHFNRALPTHLFCPKSVLVVHADGRGRDARVASGIPGAVVFFFFSLCFPRNQANIHHTSSFLVG